MNVDALVKLYYVALVISTAVAIVLAAAARRYARRNGEHNALILVGPIVAAVIAGGFFIAVTGAGYYSTPGSCIGCHEMLPEYNAWRRSAHGRVTCLACHLQASGVGGYAVEEGRALKEVWQHFTGYPKIINRDSAVSQKEMDSGVCERCHNRTKLGVTRFNGSTKIDHQDHLELGITCQHCHNRIAHKGARGFNYLDGLGMMDGCMRCHLPGAGKRIGDERAPTGCSTCHPKGWARKVFGKPEVAKADFDDCRACHRLSDPSVVSGFAASEMSEAVDCSDCHNDHFDGLMVDPDPVQCNKCHQGIAKKVVKGTHGGKKKGELKSVPTSRAKVRCSVCHPPHKFPVPGDKTE